MVDPYFNNYNPGNLQPEASYDQVFAASGGYGGCGCGCGGGYGGGLFGGDSDILSIPALGILAGISIYLATTLTAGKKKRGKVSTKNSHSTKSHKIRKENPTKHTHD